METFQTAFRFKLPHGECLGLDLGLSANDEICPRVLELLHPKEREFSRDLPPRRRTAWVGGRLALRRLLPKEALEWAVLPDEKGAPILPPGLKASISHKGGLAVALVGTARDGELGVDLEIVKPGVEKIARRVLTDQERGGGNRSPGGLASLEVLLRFSIKEALYKACNRGIDADFRFQDAGVSPGKLLLQNAATRGFAELVFHGAWAKKLKEAQVFWMLHQGYIIATARVKFLE